MAQRLTNIDPAFISLVDKGANKRTHAVLKADGFPRGKPRHLRKGDVATFGDLVAREEFAGWLPGAVDALSGAIHEAIYGEGARLSKVDRAQALVNAVDQFRDALLDRGADTILKRDTRVSWRGRM